MMEDRVPTENAIIVLKDFMQIQIRVHLMRRAIFRSRVMIKYCCRNLREFHELNKLRLLIVQKVF